MNPDVKQIPDVHDLLPVHPELCKQYLKWCARRLPDVAKDASLDQTTFRKYMNGIIKAPRRSNLAMLADAMSCGPHRLSASDLVKDAVAVTNFILRVYRRCAPDRNVDEAIDWLTPHLNEPHVRWEAEIDRYKKIPFRTKDKQEPLGTREYLDALFHGLRLDDLTIQRVLPCTRPPGEKRGVYLVEVRGILRYRSKKGKNKRPDTKDVPFANTYFFNEEMRLNWYENVFNPDRIVEEFEE